MRATAPNGSLKPIPNCYIEIPSFGVYVDMKILPDISDSKSASYSDEAGIGRSMPFKNYQSSENRSISWTAHFMVCETGDQQTIIEYLRAFEACSYPMEASGGAPFTPPPICKLRCGHLLSDLGANDISAVLKSYSVKFDTNVPWDTETFIPYKLDVEMQFDVVYNQSELPGANMILISGV